MATDTHILRRVPLFAPLEDEDVELLASRIEVRTFAARQRIYAMGNRDGRAYALISGAVRLTTVDHDQQDVIVDEPLIGELFGFASMLDGTPHQTSAIALERTVCLEITHDAIAVLVSRSPDAAMGMLSALGKHFHGAQQLVRLRAARNPNELIEAEATPGDRIADAVASFGGSWKFIILFLVLLVGHTVANLALRRLAWDPYPFILLNLLLSMVAALQAPVIMMSQNRQDTKDRLRGELDFEINRRAEAEVQNVSSKLNLMMKKIDDLEELVLAHVNTRRPAPSDGSFVEQTH